MLDQKDELYVRAALTNEIARLAGDPRAWLVNQVNHESFALDLGFNLGAAKAWADRAYQICAEDQWHHDPNMLFLLVSALPQNERTARIVAMLQKRPPEPADPARARWLATGYPLLDRDELKDSVLKLLPDDGKIILTVNGPKKCGKSYTAEYIQYLSSSFRQGQDRFRITRLSLEGGTGATYAPTHLFRDLLRKMDLDGRVPDREGRPANAWLRDVCAELLYLAREHRWWWILDGYCAPDLHEETRMMLGELTLQATEGETARRVRIILLDYPKKLDHVQVWKVQEEQLQPASSIGEHDIREFFLDYAARSNVALTDQQLDKILQRVLTGIDQQDERRLKSINDLLHREINAF